MKLLMFATLVLAAGLTMAGESNPANSSECLEGLFGVKFEDVLKEGGTAMTNEQGLVFSAFSPAKKFLSFSDYVQFATPVTRKIYRIRAVAPSVPSESQSFVDTAVRLIELRFGVTATAKDGCRVLTFADGNFIRVAQEPGRVVLDAVCLGLEQLVDQEAQTVCIGRANAEARSFSDDIRALQLVLKTQASGPSNMTLAVCSVLGKAFGESLTEADRAVRLEDGSWVAKIVPAVSFAGCTVCEAFGSAKTKGIFRVRILRDGTSAPEDFVRVRKAVEFAFKTPMSQKKGEDDFCSLQVGGLLVTLSRKTEGDRISLDFTDPKTFVRHEEELKSLPEKKLWQDIDAL